MLADMMISNESRIIKSRMISQYDEPRQYITNLQLRLQVCCPTACSPVACTGAWHALVRQCTSCGPCRYQYLLHQQAWGPCMYTCNRI